MINDDHLSRLFMSDRRVSLFDSLFGQKLLNAARKTCRYITESLIVVVLFYD